MLKSTPTPSISPTGAADMLNDTPAGRLLFILAVAAFVLLFVPAIGRTLMRGQK